MHATASAMAQISEIVAVFATGICERASERADNNEKGMQYLY